MLKYIKSLLVQKFSPKYIPDKVWFEVVGTTPIFKNLTVTEKIQLRKLTRKFLHKKNITTVHDLELTPYMAVVIAAQACLLILNLGFNYYDGWTQVILYPSAFKVNHEYTDVAGVVHKSNRALSGEAWSQGPIILSWEDIHQDVHFPRYGHNIVIHEFAHKLDMLTGSANGMPPLHASMVREKWTETLSSAYQQLNQQLYDEGSSTINSYAATDPAEFFAVITEYLFTAPDILKIECPEVFQLFVDFYQNNKHS